MITIVFLELVTKYICGRLYLMYICDRLYLMYTCDRLYLMYICDRLYLMYICDRLYLMYISDRLYLMYICDRLYLMQHCLLYSHVTNDMVVMDLVFSKYGFTIGWREKKREKRSPKTSTLHSNALLSRSQIA